MRPSKQLARSLRALGMLQRLIGFSHMESFRLLNLVIARRAGWTEDGCRLSEAV